MENFSALLALCAGNSPVPVNSPHKGQWRGALMFSLFCVCIDDWVNNREAGDLRRHRGHYNVNVMAPAEIITEPPLLKNTLCNWLLVIHFDILMKKNRFELLHLCYRCHWCCKKVWWNYLLDIRQMQKLINWPFHMINDDYIFESLVHHPLISLYIGKTRYITFILDVWETYPCLHFNSIWHLGCIFLR